MLRDAQRRRERAVLSPRTRRVRCPVKITAGLSDWVCPPSGVWVLYNNLPGPAELTKLQGLDHAVYPGYNGAKVARTTHRK